MSTSDATTTVSTYLKYICISQSATNKCNLEHEPEYFAATVRHSNSPLNYLGANDLQDLQEHLSDQDLVGFSADDFEQVRAATSAYGIHLFGKLRIPAMPDPSGPAYIHFRVFIGGGDEPPKLHSIHTEEREDSSGGKTYRAVFTKNDELEWFDT